MASAPQPALGPYRAAFSSCSAGHAVSTARRRSAEVPAHSRSPGPRRPRRPSGDGQRRNPQDPCGSALASRSSALACPLHADRRLLAQPGRALLRAVDRETASARCPSFDAGTRAGHSPLHRHRQRRPTDFRWTKSADDILATIERFCLRTLDTAERQTEIIKISKSGH